MDNDANVLNNAVARLQQQFGNQVPGSREQGLATMSRAIQAQLGLDDLTADRVVKKLADVGRLRYVMTGEDDDTPAVTPIGPVASLPGVYTSSGSGELIVPAAQALGTASVLGGVPTDGGILSGAEPVAATDRSATAAGEPYDAGEPLGPADLSSRKAENQEGSTAGGQLADTNAEGGVRRPVTVGERQEFNQDNSQGYWQIS